jgi:aminopeptidase N
MRLRRNPDVPAQAPSKLDGEDLNLARVLVNGAGCSFKMDGSWCWKACPKAPEPFDLEIFTSPAPLEKNRLMGLYVSQGTFSRNAEYEGFAGSRIF